MRRARFGLAQVRDCVFAQVTSDARGAILCARGGAFERGNTLVQRANVTLSLAVTSGNVGDDTRDLSPIERYASGFGLVGDASDDAFGSEDAESGSGFGSSGAAGFRGERSEVGELSGGLSHWAKVAREERS